MNQNKLFRTGPSSIIAFLLLPLFFSCQPKNNSTGLTYRKSIKINTILTRIDSLFEINPDSAFRYNLALLKSDSIKGDSIFYFNLYEKLGYLKCYNGEVDSALFYFNHVRSFFESKSGSRDEENFCKLLYNIAYVYYSKGELNQSISLLEETASLCEKQSFSKTLLHAKVMLSSVYQFSGDYGKSLECIEESIQLCRLANDSSSMIPTLQAYADLYVNCFMFEEAEEQFRNVLNYSKHFSTYTEFNHYNSKGRMHYLKGEYPAAKTNFLKAFEVCDKKERYAYLIVLSNLAETSLLSDELDSARYYLDLLKQDESYLKGLPVLFFNFNSLYGEYFSKKAQYVQASRVFSVADGLAKIVEVDKVVMKLHKKRKVRFYEALGDFKNAYHEMADYNLLNEQLLEENSRKQVAALKYKFQRDTTILQQKNDIEMGQQQIRALKIRQAFFVTGILVLLLMGGLIVLYFRKSRALNHEKNMRKMALLKMENIRSRISPHFVFNILNNIWAIIDNREQARKQFDHLIHLIRRSLVNTECLAISLTDELEFVKSYIELERLRLDQQLKVVWEIGDGFDADKFLVPGMILQIPVENAIKHGLAAKPDNRQLLVKIEEADGFVLLYVIDNGAGALRANPKTGGTGTGLKVITNTIQLLNQVNEKKITYEMTDRSIEGESGTKVVIRIPVHYNYNLN